jgi:hypothetical protein
MGLDRVFERAAVDLDRVGHPAAQAPREDRRAHHEVVGQRHIGPHALGHLADGCHVGGEIVLELRLGELGVGLGLEALVAVGHVDRQHTADVGHVHLHAGQRRRVAVLAEQVHLVAEAGERRRELGVVDVGAGPAQEVTVEDEDAHGGSAYASTVDTLVAPDA